MSEFYRVVKKHFGRCFLLCDYSPNQLDFLVPAWNYEKSTEYFRLLWNFYTLLMGMKTRLECKWYYHFVNYVVASIKSSCNSKILLLGIYSSEMKMYFTEKKYLCYICTVNII